MFSQVGMHTHVYNVWVEKYRPQSLDDIVLEPTTRHILTNVLETRHFPNLLLYGPPGTGKTTTIVNLIQAYLRRYGEYRKELIMHLNASDERGIDTIRNQVHTFVNAQNLFAKGMKFVVLDEVDYMTKNAQQALRYLLHQYRSKVRFCLICNYISKIDKSLQHDLMRLRFNQLPPDCMVDYMASIVAKEGLEVSRETLSGIQQLFKSDMRSMINHLQSKRDCFVVGEETYAELWSMLCAEKKKGGSGGGSGAGDGWSGHPLYAAMVQHQMDECELMLLFLKHLFRHRRHAFGPGVYAAVQNALHSRNVDPLLWTLYVWEQLVCHLLP